MSPRPRAGRHVRPFAKSQHQGQPGPGGAPPAAYKRASGWRHGRAWPCRDGGDGLLGRGGIVHTQRAQARAHTGAGAGASRRHRWASAAARPGCSRRHLAHAPRSAAVPPALCWPGPWKGPQSRARPAAPRPGCPHFHAGPWPRPRPAAPFLSPRWPLRGTAVQLGHCSPQESPPDHPPSLLSHVLGLPDVLALRATAGRPPPAGAGAPWGQRPTSPQRRLSTAGHRLGGELPLGTCRGSAGMRSGEGRGRRDECVMDG